jgi:CRISPR-associated protein Cmr6
MLPLPQRNVRTRALSGLNCANAGLVWDKFVDGWSMNDRGEYGLHHVKKGKGDWVGEFSVEDLKFGEQDELTRACKHINALATATIADKFTDSPLPSRSQHYTTISRFVTGLGLTHPVENGFVWHHTLGAPYLPGSSVKGMMRAWADHWKMADGDDKENRKLVLRLFGDDDDSHTTMGALIVFDALPLKPVQLVHEVLTPHDGGWRLSGPGDSDPPLSPGDWHDPNPVPFLAVEIGAKFQFVLGLTRHGEAKDLELGYRLWEEALEWIGAGAKTATGFGRFESSAKGADLLVQWQSALKDGDFADFFGKRVRLREVDHAGDKAGLVDAASGESLKRRDISKLKPV